MIRDAVNRRLFQIGRRVAPGLTPASVHLLGRLAYAGARLDRTHLETYADNLRSVLGREPDPALLRAGMTSWMRTYLEVLALPAWSPEDILDRVATVGERHLREAWDGPGAVIALPHLANWDLAGAWACLKGYPVTTVAENLGAREFAAFTAVRASLGMEVLPHDDPTVPARLIRAARRRRLICLLSDRDLPGTGVPVTFADHQVTMPAGPALVARRTGSVLLAAAGRYTDNGMVLEISAPIETRPDRDGLLVMTQEVADFFVAKVRQSPADWHMLQPFFNLRAAS